MRVTYFLFQAKDQEALIFDFLQILFTAKENCVLLELSLQSYDLGGSRIIDNHSVHFVERLIVQIFERPLKI